MEVCPEEVRAALGRLTALAVLGEGREGGYLPGNPELVVDILADLRLRQLHDEMRAVTQARHLVASLRAEQECAPAPAPVVEKIENLDSIRSRIDALAFFAREEILSAEPYTALTPVNIQHSRPLDLRCIRRGVRIKNVVLSKTVEDSLTFEYLREAVSAPAATAAAVTRFLRKSGLPMVEAGGVACAGHAPGSGGCAEMKTFTRSKDVKVRCLRRWRPGHRRHLPPHDAPGPRRVVRREVPAQIEARNDPACTGPSLSGCAQLEAQAEGCPEAV
ncbi:hypothetical protein [Streptomyces sp. NPDC050164]|uniref:hypothetical protein n=1 Tax=Streptomyces sp. NPDC050164 TaxID=3365605 RepID=UPI0037952BAF